MSPCHAWAPLIQIAVIVSPLFCVLPDMDSLYGPRELHGNGKLHGYCCICFPHCVVPYRDIETHLSYSVFISGAIFYF